MFNIIFKVMLVLLFPIDVPAVDRQEIEIANKISELESKDRREVMMRRMEMKDKIGSEEFKNEMESARLARREVQIRNSALFEEANRKRMIKMREEAGGFNDRFIELMKERR